MADEQTKPAGPDLTLGVALSEFSGETLLGHVGEDDVLLVRAGPDIFAIDAHCSHYHGPLAEGLVVGESIRCPWHHACFDLRTGEAARAPALNPLAVWRVEREGERIFVRNKEAQPKPRIKGAVEAPGKIVIIGGGAGMAPILSLLRTMAERGLSRKATFFYGARTKKDLCFEAELHELEERLPDFRYIPALSEPGNDEEWDGETGLITDVVKRHASDLRGAHAYVCGPPPMVEAALPLLATLGVEERRIYYDKFTTTGNPQE